ncbi:MAG: hypothetical protein MZV63_20255 [Marinilabiliales bacterium]|nr:hypothetical protein [Marinilabiliales bacterium]
MNRHKEKSMIVDTLKNKSVLKTKGIMTTPAAAFMMVKDILKNLAKEVNVNLDWRMIQGYGWSTLTEAALMPS